MKKIIYFLQFLIVYFLFIIFKIIGYKNASNLGFLIGGVVIVEKIFTFPGFGNLLIDSIKFRDLPLVEATILIAAAFYIFANLLTDILSIIFNPKLRKQ